MMGGKGSLRENHQPSLDWGFTALFPSHFFGKSLKLYKPQLAHCKMCTTIEISQPPCIRSENILSLCPAARRKSSKVIFTLANSFRIARVLCSWQDTLPPHPQAGSPQETPAQGEACTSVIHSFAYSFWMCYASGVRNLKTTKMKFTPRGLLMDPSQLLCKLSF